MLNGPLKTEVPLATCVTVGGFYFQVLQDANVGDARILVSKAYITLPPLKKLPGKNLLVKSLGYDHKTLVTCAGKPAGDFTQGSSMMTIAYSESTTGDSYTRGLVNASGKSQISTYSQSPFFSSPPCSTALQLSNDSVYTMLEETVTTTASPGITFESWIKVDRVAETVLVAYTSERAPRSERTKPEQQTFVLAIPASSSGSNYDLVGNANGSLFTVSNPSALKLNQWVHVACSSRNAFALRFSGSNYVDLGAAAEWNVSDFSLAFTLQLDNIGSEQILFTKAAAANSTTPLHVKVTRAGNLCLSYYAENEDNSTVKERSVTSQNALKQGIPYKVFLSRALVRVNKKDGVPRSVQLVTMRAWGTNGNLNVELNPPSMTDLETSVNKLLQTIDLNGQGPAQACGLAQNNESPLVFGGAPWASGGGLVGSIGSVRLYSTAIKVPTSHTALCIPDNTERSKIGSWSFRDAGGVSLVEDSGRNNGKLKKDPDWILSPYEPDHSRSVFINGKRTVTSHTAESTLLKNPAGPHQLTLGNSLSWRRHYSLPGHSELISRAV